jgi:RNA polymerase sigma-70 factor, ECF subfamily
VSEHEERQDEEPDAEVIGRVLGGDVARFRVLVERYQRRLICFVRNIVRERGEAEDLTQDVLLAVFANLHRYDPARGRFSCWLFAIARNRCRSALEKARALPIARTDEVDGRQAPSAEHESELQRREALRQLDLALDALPLDQKVAFVLAEVMELNLEEIAQIEGVRLGTVKSRVSRAKAKLRQALDGQRRELDARR